MAQIENVDMTDQEV